MQRSRDANILFFDPGLNLADYANAGLIANWRLPNPQPTWPDPDLTRSLRSFDSASDSDYDEEASFFDSNAEDFTIDENIFAVYGLADMDFGKLDIVAGVRVEATEIDMSGKNVTEDTLTATDISFSDDYTHVFPSINAKYELNEKSILRAAYYTSLVRPSFGDMAPFVRVNDDRDEIELENPNLDPYFGQNFDVTFEYYPTDLSVISAGLFYKDIKDAIYPNEYDLVDVPSNIDLSQVPADLLDGTNDDGDTVSVATAINVDESSILGLELNYVQSLGDLVPALDGFVSSANLTLVDSEATLPNGRKVRFLN